MSVPPGLGLSSCVSLEAWSAPKKAALACAISSTGKKLFSSNMVPKSLFSAVFCLFFNDSIIIFGPFFPFKYFNIKGYLTPIYWGSATSGNIATRLFSDPQILNGYVIFGENMGSKDRGSYGTGQGFIRPYGNSRDNDRDSEWQYIVSLSTASKYLNEKYWTKVPSSLGFYEYLTLDSSAVSALKRESKKVLGNFYAEVIDKMVNDSEFIKWKSGGDNKKGKIVEVETLEDKLKALQTDDYQNRKGNYPKDGVADTIQYWDNSLSFEFKNTDERGAERWVKNFLSGKNLSPKKIKAEQTGDYRDDWVTVTANFK